MLDFRDLCLLTVSKSVAITNSRLNIFAMILNMGVVGFVLWNLITQKPYSSKVESVTKTFVEVGAETVPSAIVLNKTEHNMCPPGQSLEAVDALISSWSNLPANHVRQRAEGKFAPASWLKHNPSLLQASRNCLPVCTGVADSNSLCMSPSTFMDERDSSHVALWTARHVLRSDGIFVDSFVGLSVVASTIKLGYSYQLDQAVPTLSQFLFGAMSGGDHTTTQTVLVNSKGAPGRRLPFGSQVELTLTELLGNAQGLPQNLLEGTEPAWELFRDGLELNVEVLCYSDDVELMRSGKTHNAGDWDLHATITAPVCLLEVKYFSCSASFAAPEVTVGGSVALNRAVVVRASVGTSTMWFPSFDSLLLVLTSSIVLLQIPSRFLRWFTLHCLGQLSKLYKRVIVQKFDIQQEAATMSVNLMSNSVSFLELSDSFIGKNSYPGISRARMEERMKAALQQRRHVLSDSELSAFVTCCFDALQFGEGDHFDIQKEMIGASEMASEMMSRPSTATSTASVATFAKQGTFKEDVIDIDTFNVHCSMGNGVNLEGMVDLFDQDRKRHFVERLFTPPGLQRALKTVQKAKDESDQEKFEEDVLEELEDDAIPTYPTTAMNPISMELHSNALSLEDKKNSEQRLRLTLLELLEREREREEASNLQAEFVKTLQDRISTLETAMQKTAATLQSLESEESVRYSQGEAKISKVEENVQARLSELDRSLSARLNSVKFHSNPAADPPTQTEHTVQVAELADRLTMLDAETKHQFLAIKQTLKRTVASLEAQVGQHRMQIHTVTDDLREERQSRVSSDARIESRLASFEATLKLSAVAEEGMSAQNHQGAKVGGGTKEADKWQYDSHDSIEEMSSLVTTPTILTPQGAAKPPKLQGDKLPGPPRQGAANWNGFKDQCARKAPRFQCS